MPDNGSNEPTRASLRRAVATVAGGTAAAQLLLILSAPVLTRLYEPAALGAFSAVVALAGAFGGVASLRLESAIPLPEDDVDASSLCWTAVVAAVISALVATAVVAVLGDQLSAGLGLADPRSIWLFPVILGLFGIAQALTQLAIRQRRFRASGDKAAVHAGVSVVLQTAAPLLSFGGSGALLSSYAVGQAASIARLCPGSRLRPRGSRRAAVQRARVLVRRYRRFPTVAAPGALLNALGLQLPVLLLAHHYTASDAGWFGMTQRVVAIPASVIGLAVAQVFLSEAARAIRSDPARLLRLFDRTTTYLLAIAAVVVVSLVALGPSTFSLVLGAEWETSGEFARAFALTLGLQLVSSPLASTLTVLERQGTQLLLDGFRVVALLTVVAAVAESGGSALDAVWAMTGVLCPFYLAYWLMARRALTTELRKDHVA